MILVFDAEDYGVRFLLRNTKSSFVLFGSITNIGTEASTLNYHIRGEKQNIELSEVNDVAEAVAWAKDFLIQKKFIKDLSDIRIIGQRIVHGGSEFKVPTLITDTVVNKLHGLTELAPEHMAYNIQCVSAVKKYFPGIRQVGVFDTSFHSTLPPHAYLYAIPYNYIQKYNIRRYGFHGISHKYMMGKAITLGGFEKNNSRIITLHLGHGCSMTAIKNGVSVDTTMGFSPLEGLVMKERAGSVNFDVASFLHTKENLSFEELNTTFYRFSGLYGLSGGLNSIEEIISEMEKGNEIAAQAFNVFIYTIRKQIGAYMLTLGGLDAIVMTGLLVKFSPIVRSFLFDDLNQFGIKLDPDKNDKYVDKKEGDISSSSSKVKLYYVKQAIRMAISNEIEKML